MDDEDAAIQLQYRIMRSFIDHMRYPDAMINAMLNSIGTQRSQLLERANHDLLNRGVEITLQSLTALRRHRSRLKARLNGMIHQIRDRPGNIYDELTIQQIIEYSDAVRMHEFSQQLIEYSDAVRNHQLLLERRGVFMRRMVPFMTSFTVHGPRRFDFPFPFCQSISRIILWLNARIKIASPRSELSANPDFVEMHQLSVVFGLSGYNDLIKLDWAQSYAILKTLHDKNVFNTQPFQEHMQNCKERGILPANFRVDGIYRRIDCGEMNRHLCALYLDLLDGHVDNAMRRSFILCAWGAASRP